MELSILDKYNPAKFRTFEPGNICFRRDAVASTLKAMYTNPMSKSYVHLQSHYRDELRPILNSLKEVSFHQGRQLIEVLNAFNSLAFGLTPLLEKYPIGVFFCDDDSVSVEWRMTRAARSRRLRRSFPIMAFGSSATRFSGSSAGSSWTLSSNENAGHYSEGGYFPNNDRIESVLTGILEKILKYKSALI